MKKIDWDNLKLDALFIVNPINIRYFTNLKVSLGHLIITKEKSTIYLDGRYYENATKNAVHNLEVKLLDFNEIAKDIKKLKKVGYESDFVTIDRFNTWKKFNKKMVNINSQSLRIIKDLEDRNNIDKAGQIAFEALEFTIKNIKEGMTEKQIGRVLENKMYELGSEENAFDTIVASGPNGSLPHHQPSDRKIENNELITIDFGATVNGFRSDITRTIKFGDSIPKQLLEIYEVVKQAQMKGIEAVKPGVTTNQIDAVCRKYIKDAGYEKYFVHGTGHGLGMDVHELPYVTFKKDLDVELIEGHVITVEPGIYIPNLGGVRIEDDILVTVNGYKILGKNEIEYLK